MRSPPKLLDGKAIVVTGAGRGLGRAYVIDAAARGAVVIVNDVDVDQANRVSEEIRAAGGIASPNGDSVSNWRGAEALIDQCIREVGRIDGLVNNAGIFYLAKPGEELESPVRDTVDANLLGTIFCGTHAIRQMLARGSGTIVNVTSGAQMGMPLMGTYGATKGAISSLTYSWALDLYGSGVRVNAISPMARTRMGDWKVKGPGLTDKKRALVPPIPYPPESNAPLVAYFLSDLSMAISGQVVRIVGHEISIVSHPALTKYRISSDNWTPEAIGDALIGPLRAGLQVVGFGPNQQRPTPP